MRRVEEHLAADRAAELMDKSDAKIRESFPASELHSSHCLEVKPTSGPQGTTREDVTIITSAGIHFIWYCYVSQQK